MKEHNPNWPKILDLSYRMLIGSASGSGKTNTLLYLIRQQNDDDHKIIDKLYLYIMDPNEPKHQYFIKKRKNLVLKTWKIQRLLYAELCRICRISVKLLKSTPQVEKLKY